METRELSRRRYALVGCGVRGISMYARPITKYYSDAAQLVAVCDTNRARMSACLQYCAVDLPTFTSLDDMLREMRPDALIVCAPDYTHHDCIIRALESGTDAITEKPMTIDEDKCRAILDAERRTGRRVVVAFNYRYSPQHQQIKRLIREGAIGRVLSVDFHWPLDYIHGADFFRRWHRRMEHSGGLLVHKATHHFDLVNWWIDSEPCTSTPRPKTAISATAACSPTRSTFSTRCPSTSATPTASS